MSKKVKSSVIFVSQMERSHPGGWGVLGTLVELGVFGSHVCTAAASEIVIAGWCVLCTAETASEVVTFTDVPLTSLHVS